VFYQVIVHRASIKEFWRETKLFFWVGLIVKLFRLTPRASTDDLAVDSLHPFEIQASQIPPATTTQFRLILDQLEMAGFTGEPIWHDENDIFQATHNTLAHIPHSSGHAFARVQCRVYHGRVPPKIKFFTTFITRRSDGHYLVTTNGKCDMAWPQEHEVERYLKLPVDTLFARHQVRLSQQRLMLPRVDARTLADEAEAYHVSLRDFHLARGVFKEMPESEHALYEASLPAPHRDAAADAVQPTQLPPMPGATAPPPLPGAAAAVAPAAVKVPLPDLLETATMAELERIQRKTSSWGSTITILAVSVLVFVLSMKGQSNPADGSGARKDWMFLVSMVVILFIHESGHYLAMRGFGYRNVKMFFIPFFGAAVTGQHYNVPGWKKVIVSLMGPLPGIGLGLIAGALGVYLKKPWLEMAGILAMILNGFNLLPILPLDGGWVAHTVLFSRHYMLDIGFRLIAALGLLALSFIGPGDRFLMYIAIATVVSLPSTITLAKIVSDLRAEGFVPASPDGKSIPQESARLILAKLRQRIKRNLNAKMAAQHVAKVFETLNAKPPNAIASVGFMTLHFGAVLIAVVGVIGIMTFRAVREDPLRFSNFVSRQKLPEHKLNPDDIAVLGSAQLAPDYTSVVLTFVTDEQSRAAATKALAELTTDAATPRRITRIANALVISFNASDTAAREQILSHWEHQAADAFVESEKYRAMLTMTCAAPTIAKADALESELQGYFRLRSYGHAMPPWAGEEIWPAARRSVDLSARQLLTKLQEGPDMDYDSPQFKQMTTDSLAAIRKGDTAAVERIGKQRQELVDAAEQKFRRQMLAENADSALTAAWFRVNDEKDYKKRLELMESQIGPLIGAWPADQPPHMLTLSGFALRKLDQIQFHYVQFNHADAGVPAMIRWLASEGCKDFKFELTGANGYSDEDWEDQ
jgi:Zn-dependent protease